MTVTIREKKLQDGRSSLYLDVYTNGKRSYEFLKLYLLPETPQNRNANRELMELVERIRAKRLLELQHLKFGFTPEFKSRLNFLDYFKEQLKKRLKTGTNYDTWKITLVHLEKFAPKGLTFDQIDDGWMENFRNYLQEGRSNNSAAAYFNVLKHCLHQAVRDRIIVDNPATRIKSPKSEETEREFLTSKEVSQMIGAQCHNPELKRAFLFSCFTGLRWSDILNLKWTNIRENDKGELSIHFTQKKTKGVEYLPINKQAEKLLQKRGGDDEKIFALQPSSNKSSHLREWASNAGIKKKITYHCSRHTYAVMLLENGVKIYTVSKLLGHRDIKTTLVYANILDETKRKAVNSITDLPLDLNE